uniref:PHD and ring finger domains 1 n=1 Tax=Stegastes partitus TaxID=144197 RepID=A0A3B5A7S2_9TELE
MDEDDSQDELINRSTSHSKGKRAALWAISDDSDDCEEESEEGESDSGEEEEEDHVNGEDEEEEEEEEEEDDAKPKDGAFGGTSTDFAGLSSDEDSDKCPICLNSFTSQPVATPENCEHYFCFDCILEWAKNANSCPVDRISFNSVYLRKCFGGKVKKMITVQKPVKEGQEETVDVDLEQTNCEVCGGSDREDRLLLCDGCDAGYHMECLTPPLDSVPVEEWFCPECEANNRNSSKVLSYFILNLIL